MTRILKLGTRGSQLALWQANWVKRRLENFNPDLEIELTIISTRGDREQNRPLEQLGTTGLFVKEIERALEQGEIDFAVHSAKDLPAELPEPFELAAITEREDPRDVLLSTKEVPFAQLPTGAHLATGSPRRKAQLLASRPDLHLEPLRGNLDTRIRKMLDAKWDGIVAAWAGVKRLGYLRFVADFLPLDICLPAAGQGALALEVCRDNAKVRTVVRALSAPETEAAVRAERAFLKAIGAGCHHPVGVLGQIRQRRLFLRAIVGSPDGTRVLHAEAEGVPSHPEDAGRSLAEKMWEKGAEALLQK